MLTKTLSKVFVSTDTSKDWILVEMVPTFAVPVFEKGFRKKKIVVKNDERIRAKALSSTGKPPLCVARAKETRAFLEEKRTKKTYRRKE